MLITVNFVLTLDLAWALRPDTPGSTLPHAQEIRPVGVQRGVATELTVHGSALAGNPRFVAPFKFTVEDAKADESDTVVFKARITADPATPIGVYPIMLL